VSCPRRLPQGEVGFKAGGKSYVDFGKNSWQAIDWGCDYKCWNELGGVCVKSLFDIGRGSSKMQEKKVCECPAGKCAFNGACIDASAWLDWGKALAHSAGPDYAANYFEFVREKPEDDPFFMVIKAGWDSDDAMGLYGSPCNPNGEADPWTGEHYTLTSDSITECAEGLHFKDMGDKCVCEHTGLIKSGCLVQIPAHALYEKPAQTIDKKEGCIHKTDKKDEHDQDEVADVWETLFGRWMQIAKLNLPLQKVTVSNIVDSSLFFGTACRKSTTLSCSSNACPSDTNAVCSGDQMCHCNDGYCVWDLQGLGSMDKFAGNFYKDYKCFEYTDWTNTSSVVNSLADVPFATKTSGTHIEETDGAKTFDMPDFPSFDLAPNCNRKFEGVRERGECHPHKNAIWNTATNPKSCECNIDKCIWDGRCINYDQWYNLLMGLTLITES